MSAQPAKSWLERLADEQAEQVAQQGDPWREELKGLRGIIGDDRIERVTTEGVFDFLQIAQHSRSTGLGRRLSSVMAGLGWSPVRVYAPNRRGFREQVRGYCRDTRPLPLSAS